MQTTRKQTERLATPYRVRAGRPDDWAGIQQWIAKALDIGKESATEAELQARLNEHTCQLWVIEADALTGFAVTYLDAGTFYVWLAGGRSMDWIPDFIEFTRPVARRAGCTHIASAVRPGLVGGLKEIGAKTTHYRMELAL